MQSEHINELAGALALAQGEFPVLEKKSKAYNYMYADLAETLQATQCILAKNGLSIVHIVSGESLTSKLLHKSGQWIETQMPLMYKADGKVNAMQALGSAITYAKRYNIGCLLNLAADKEIDDDGHKAGHVNHHTGEIRTNLPPAVNSSPGEIKNGLPAMAKAFQPLSPEMIAKLNPLFAEDLDAVDLVAEKYKCHWTKIPADQYGVVLKRLQERKRDRELEENDEN